MTPDEAGREYDRLADALFASPLMLAVAAGRPPAASCMGADEWLTLGRALGHMDALWPLMLTDGDAPRPLFGGEPPHVAIGAAAALATSGRRPASWQAPLLPREPRGEG